MTEHDLWVATGKDILIAGDSFTEVVYKTLYTENEIGQKVILGKTPQELWPIASQTMRIIPDDQTGRLPDPPLEAYKQDDVNSVGPSFTSDQIIHISEGNVTGRLYGIPRLLSALVLIATQTMSLRYNLKTFTGQKVPKAMRRTRTPLRFARVE